MFKQLTRRAFTLVLTLATVLTVAITTPLMALADGGGKWAQPVTVGAGQTIDTSDDCVYAIKNNGELWAITEAQSGKVLDDCVSISTGTGFAFALKSDGIVWSLSENDLFNDGFKPEQILNDLPEISVVYADYNFWNYDWQMFAITQGGVLYRYEWLDEPSTLELASGVKSVSGNYGKFYVQKSDNTLWSMTSNIDSDPILTQIVDGVETLIEDIFTNPANRKNSMGQTLLYIDTNGNLQFDGNYYDEEYGEWFGLGKFEVAKDVAAFVNTDQLTILKKDGTLWTGVYIFLGNLGTVKK
jgi:hypothetical protein